MPVFQRPFYIPRLWGWTFQNWKNTVIFPLGMVAFPWCSTKLSYELAILFQRVKERLFRILPNGSIINGYFKYGRCKYTYLYGFRIPDSLSMRSTFSLTFRNEMIIFSFYQQFQVSINRHYCTIHRTNDFQNELWLATFDSSGNASEMISFTIPQSVTISEQRFGGQETLNHQSEGLPFR